MAEEKCVRISMSVCVCARVYGEGRGGESERTLNNLVKCPLP